MLARVFDLHVPFKSLTLPRLKKVQADLVKRLSPSTVNNILFKVVRQALEHAVDEGWLRTNPAERIKHLKKRETIREQHSWTDCWRIIEEAGRYSPESAEILCFMLSFGCGQAEIKDFRGQHIHQDHVAFKRRKTGRVV